MMRADGKTCEFQAFQRVLSIYQPDLVSCGLDELIEIAKPEGWNSS
jgi:hypothetical protein